MFEVGETNEPELMLTEWLKNLLIRKQLKFRNSTVLKSKENQTKITGQKVKGDLLNEKTGNAQLSFAKTTGFGWDNTQEVNE